VAGRGFIATAGLQKGLKEAADRAKRRKDVVPEMW
jgi:hypothetical protein